MCRVISFVSVEGGVGQTSIVFELSKELANKNYKICVVDGCFGFNVISQKYNIQNDIDFKEYYNVSKNVENILNEVNENLFYIKTNDLRYDYYASENLFKLCIEELKDKFDYIFFDVGKSLREIKFFLENSTECFMVVSDREEEIFNAYKIVSRIKNFNNILNKKLVINQMRIVKQIKQKCLTDLMVEELLKTEVIFSFPKFYKYNYFDNCLKNKKHKKVFEKFCYSIITNNKIVLDYSKHFKTPIGFIRKLIYEKFE